MCSYMVASRGGEMCFFGLPSGYAISSLFRKKNRASPEMLHHQNLVLYSGTALPKDSGEDRPMSIKDRIAMLSQNSDPTKAGSTTNLPVSASFSVGERKKIEVHTAH